MTTQLTGHPGAPARVRPGRLPAPLALTRPGQWPKNLLVVPLALLGGTLDTTTVARVLVALGAFILASSLVYVLNDIADVERDKRHPVKRHRPLASGRMSTASAVTTALVLGALLVPALFTLGSGAALIVLLYLAVNGAYSWKLKHLPSSTSSSSPPASCSASSAATRPPTGRWRCGWF